MVTEICSRESIPAIVPSSWGSAVQVRQYGLVAKHTEPKTLVYVY